ncbi:hemerythrin domain-containing protein [uncultured Paenibacillus sp.]|uniref:hemerythrin domain-containing protein n=1 Tax=uncultured Paenibacillus sp. TaxID=227322 RepID=UPI0028D6D220|nr:hemerythrin domain-containing protein [uncultured Paenibacillus sp.]
MNGKTSLPTVSQDSARPTDFMYAVGRLKEEHDRLNEQVKVLYTDALEAGRETDADTALRLLGGLRERTVAFALQLEAHSEWEEREMFPLVSDYFHKRTVPSITPSFWVMEKDHELALLFIGTFMELTEDNVPAARIDLIRQAASNMVQACLILQEHFRLEEELIFPLADEMLTDIDYFYS